MARRDNRRRWPYRAVQELEATILHQFDLLVLLEAARREARTPEAWHRINEISRHAESVFDWLYDLRREMQLSAPDDDDAPR